MDNLTSRQVNFGVSPPQGGYDVEFYNTPAESSTSRGCWKIDPHGIGGNVPGGANPLINNNNNISPGHDIESDGSFAISVTTGDSELFIDELIELADESAGSCSSAMSTPSPVLVQSSKTYRNLDHTPIMARSLSTSGTTTLPFHSRLHEALTQPRLPTQPVRCHRCGNELTSRCLMQTCADDARCRQCGSELTAKCILAVCTVQPKMEPPDTSYGQPPPRKRVHHYSTPS
jgi:hypothetical protein